MAYERRKILVINPNSNTVVTKGLSDALKPLRFAGGPLIEVMTNEDGPPGSKRKSMSRVSRCRCVVW